MEEYALCTEAAKAAGVIKTIFPYERESSVIKKARLMLSQDLGDRAFCHTYLFDDDIPMQELPFDRQFCQLLRAGIDDPFAILLFTILPNVGEIFLGTALHWPRPKHGFKALRRLQAGDIRTLLHACPQLETLYFSTAAEESELHNFTCKELCDALEPLKDTLEELYLEVKPQLDEFGHPHERITSLSQFTALKILDTVPEMWECLREFETEHDPIEDEQRLCDRLPPSLVTLNFHLSRDTRSFDDYTVPDWRQIEDVIVRRSERLPCLENVFIGIRYEDFAYELRETLEIIPDYQREGLSVEIGIGEAADGAIRNAFHGIPMGRYLPVTKWFGNKYASRKEKPNEFDQVMIELCKDPANIELDNQEMMKIIKADGRVRELAEKIGREGFPEVEYESEDAEDEI
ncbi:hypothetical protein P153DRAFT_356912 [Dothidotthia symphoricarpi CBS 119687]|uniref:Uncharacterized protein n=1 Tax=Dothidotthia symphoricarpi CBS 119687 TaxID=1392245 RepID=A0A6A6ADH9_9PLEO|nr:uncharacterized protein P153DRAFT_356912 [Dothidotthia symphoricarpi CBS 119687]KAF2129323.1 hypothetical protein P153DRAFT_356912 [Dothidotthia symphoricarpi CBS 119687]